MSNTHSPKSLSQWAKESHISTPVQLPARRFDDLYLYFFNYWTFSKSKERYCNHRGNILAKVVPYSISGGKLYCYNHLLTVFLYSRYACPNSISKYFSSRLIIYSWIIIKRNGRRIIVHQFPTKQVTPIYTNASPKYMGFLVIPYIPVVWSDEAGLISIKVFFVIKNCLKLFTEKNNATIKKTTPTTFISVPWHKRPKVRSFFWINMEAKKNTT